MLAVVVVVAGMDAIIAAANRNHMTPAIIVSISPSISPFLAFLRSSLLIASHIIRPPMIPKKIGSRYH
jgi:hypothetical protein